MASYHCQVKAVSRAEGRSATAAAAYRSGARIACDREGRVHDYTRRDGVERTFIVAPADAPTWAQDRERLWNAVEAAERRKDAKVAREWEVALPHELPAAEREALARAYAGELVSRYGVAADVAIHRPGREGDRRNHHAHILVTTRRIGPEGLGAKTRELDVRQTSSQEIAAMRELWADMQNRALERQGAAERVDHRSLPERRREAEARGDAEAAAVLDRPAEQHMGPQATEMERRELREAARDGRDYRPVTERGRQVHEARGVRGLLGQVRELRQRYGEARGQGASPLAALRASLGQARGPAPERAGGAGLLGTLRAGMGLAGERMERAAAGGAAERSPDQERVGPDEARFGEKGPSAQAENQAADQQRERENEAFRREQKTVADANERAKEREREQGGRDALRTLRASQREQGPQKQDRDREPERDR